MYASGLKARDVAERLSVSPTTVLRVAKRAGIYREPDTGALHPVRVAEPERRCAICDAVRPSTQFGPGRGKGRINTVCCECSGNAEARQKARTPERLDATRKLRKVKRAAATLKWQRNNRDKLKVIADRRRARKLNAPIVDLTLRDWKEILREHNNCCAYCGVTGVRLEREHVVPLTRGGSHTKSNIVPACRTCNASKNSRTPQEWRDGIDVSSLSISPAPHTIPIRPRSNSGERFYASKLTDAQVAEIRLLWAAGRLTQKRMALMFGVSPTHINKIINGHARKAG